MRIRNASAPLHGLGVRDGLWFREHLQVRLVVSERHCCDGDNYV